MDDLISRQAAMDEMSKQQTYKMFEGEDTVYLDANDVGSVLASLPSAQPEQTNSWCINSWCIKCKEYDTENKCCPRYNRVIKQTLDEVYAHAETEAEARFHAQQRWIPCSERLPEHSCQTLVTTKWDTEYSVEYGFYWGEDNKWGIITNNVIAWMPLPEPYAERRTDERPDQT